MTKPLTLWAQALWRKSGHGDGDIAGEYVNLELDYWEDFDSQDLLFALAERFLIPLLPQPVELEHFTTHNPMRVVGWEDTDAPTWAEGIEVEISPEQVMAVVAALQSGEIAYED
jgi:hypothetical protein